MRESLPHSYRVSSKVYKQAVNRDPNAFEVHPDSQFIVLTSSGGATSSYERNSSLFNENSAEYSSQDFS